MIRNSLLNIYRELSYHCSEDVSMRVVLQPEAHYVLFNLVMPGLPYTSRLILPIQNGEIIIIDNADREEK